MASGRNCYFYGVNTIVIIHTVQAFLLCLMLMTRRFRSVPNLLLVIVLGGIVVYNILNTLILNDLVAERVRLMFSAVYLIAPPLIYTYWYAYIHGKYLPKRAVGRHLLPLLIFLVITLSIALSGLPVKLSLIIMGNITVLYHLVYPHFMVKLLKSFYGIEEKGPLEVLRYSSDKTSILKAFIFMMTFHSLIFLFQSNLPLLVPSTADLHIFMKIQIFFMIVLQYLITWIIITMPVVIHFTDKKVGLASFKKYENSSLSADEAKTIARRLNAYMEEKKPYQNPLYSVQDLSRDTETDYVDIAETLNGLLGQSFNDYINNYRIEEVKRLFRNPKYKKESILSIAFESGFNSKAAFYSSFKKFTGETPTHCRNRLQSESQ